MEKENCNLPKVFVPTEKQLNYLKFLNDNDNRILDYVREEIANAVCIMAAMQRDVHNDIADEAGYIMTRLGNIQFELKKLELNE